MAFTFGSEWCSASLGMVFTLAGIPSVEAAVPFSGADGLYVGRYISNACESDELGELIHQVSRCRIFVREQEFA
jgi:hypothetical protein